MEAATPMLRRYSMWIGETERNTLIERSSSPALCVAVDTSAAGPALTSAMMRSQLR